MAKLWLLFLWLSELLCPSAAGRAISPRRSATPDTCLIFKPHYEILLPLPGEIPPLRRSLGARSLSFRRDKPDGSGRRDSGARGRRRQGPLCPLLSRPAPAAPGVASRGVAKDGSGAPCTSRCFELGSRCSPAPAFIRPFSIGRRRSLPPLPQRLPCGDGDAPADGAPGGRRAAPLSSARPRRRPQALGCVRAALGSWAANSSGPELLALGAGTGTLSRACPRGARGPRPHRSRVRGTSVGLSSGTLDAFASASSSQPHSPDRLSQRKRTLFCFSASSTLLRSIWLTEGAAARFSDQLFLLSTREHLFPRCSGKGHQQATLGFPLRSACSCLFRCGVLKTQCVFVCF